MTQTIYKYELQIEDTQTLALPKGAQVLTVQVQHGKVCLWALVNPKQPVLEDHTIEMRGTGHPIESGGLRYYSTVQLDGGRLVFHVFERVSA